MEISCSAMQTHGKNSIKEMEAMKTKELEKIAKAPLLTGIVGIILLVLVTAGCPMPVPEDVADTYTIMYDGNGSDGGNVPNDSNMYQDGQTIEVLGNTGSLVKSGHTFTGWNAQADCSGTDYAPRHTCSMGGENITLYAKWTANPTYTVAYDGNGSDSGSVPADVNNYEAGDPVTVLGNSKPARIVTPGRQV